MARCSSDETGAAIGILAFGSSPDTGACGAGGTLQRDENCA